MALVLTKQRLAVLTQSDPSAAQTQRPYHVLLLTLDSDLRLRVQESVNAVQILFRNPLLIYHCRQCTWSSCGRTAPTMSTAISVPRPGDKLWRHWA